MIAMIRMINGITGTTMWVSAERLEEYLKAGHKLATPPAKPMPTEPVKRPPKKKAATKSE